MRIDPGDICDSEYELRADETIRCTLPKGHPGEHQAFLTWMSDDENVRS
jgi:hypothetical protein